MAAPHRSAQQPKYSLEEAKRLVKSCEIGATVLKKVADFVGCERTSEASAHARRIIESLEHSDFSDNWSTVSSDGRQVVADVYGKVDSFGLWYVKFRIHNGRLGVMSCHEAEDDIILANGERRVAKRG